MSTEPLSEEDRMILRLLICIGMVVFCLWQGFAASNIPSPEGRHYFPIIYIVCPILLLTGLSPRGLVTWPVATVLLLLRGHFILGWVPLGLVIFNVGGSWLTDRWILKRVSSWPEESRARFESEVAAIKIQNPTIPPEVAGRMAYRYLRREMRSNDSSRRAAR